MNDFNEKTLLIDSKWYTEQNANDLTIYFDEYQDDIVKLRIIFIAVPCSFYNISQKIGNNNLLIHDGSSYKYINFPDGFYDFKSYDKQLSTQMKATGLQPRTITFGLDETTGTGLCPGNSECRPGWNQPGRDEKVFTVLRVQQEFLKVYYKVWCT